MCFKKLQQYHDQFYLVFRVLVGLMFFQHGAQKLLGWFGAEATVPLFSLIGLAGLLELVGGLVIAAGLFTRLAALVLGIEMLVAYFRVHASNGFAPIVNQGELALMFFAAFIILMMHGGQKWTLEKALFKKERF